MSSVFEAYDSEFNSLSQDMNKKLNEYKNYGSDIGKLYFISLYFFVFLYIFISLFILIF